MSKEIVQRIRRIYASINATVDTDLSDVVPIVRRDGEHSLIHISFRGKATDEEISNAAHSAISNIANFKDHFRRWLRQHGKPMEELDKAVAASFELRVLIDLNNNDKHGYPPRVGQDHSGVAPRLESLGRAVVFGGTPSEPAASSVEIVIEREPSVSLGEAAYRSIVGRIIDRDGNLVGHLHEFLDKGLADLEGLLLGYGVITDEP